MIFAANWLIFCLPLVLVMAWGRPLPLRKRPLHPRETAVLQERRAVVLWVGIACLVAYGLNLLLEHVVFEPRPFASHHVHLLIAHAADSSFPSDHAAWAFAMGGMFVLAFLLTWRKGGARRDGGQQRQPWILLIFPSVLTVVTLLMGCAIGLARIYGSCNFLVNR